jgi:hypothetical protein
MSDKLHRDSMFLCSKVGVRSSGDPSLDLVSVSMSAWGVGRMALSFTQPHALCFRISLLAPLPSCLREF